MVHVSIAYTSQWRRWVVWLERNLSHRIGRLGQVLGQGGSRARAERIECCVVDLERALSLFRMVAAGKRGLQFGLLIDR